MATIAYRRMKMAEVLYKNYHNLDVYYPENIAQHTGTKYSFDFETSQRIIPRSDLEDKYSANYYYDIEDFVDDSSRRFSSSAFATMNEFVGGFAIVLYDVPRESFHEAYVNQYAISLPEEIGESVFGELQYIDFDFVQHMMH